MNTTRQQIHLRQVPEPDPKRTPIGAKEIVWACEAGTPLLLPSPGRGVILESLEKPRRRLRLLADFGPGTEPAVNGEPALRFAVLWPGDVFRAGPGEPAYEVLLHCTPYVGPPPLSVVGKRCPVCRTPFVDSTRCYVCACGVAMHLELPGVDNLDCALLRENCPVCLRQVGLSEGYEQEQRHEH